MGIVLVLSINYFAILSHPKPPGESSRRLGVSLVAVSLVLNLAQTIVDGFRGWEVGSRLLSTISYHSTTHRQLSYIDGVLTCSPLDLV